jgi:hypothetical protein
MTHIGSLEATETRLRSFHGVEGAALGSLLARDTDELETLEGLGRGWDILHHIHLEGNPKLRDLRGLQHVENLMGHIQISDNANFVSLAMLGAVWRVGLIKIYEPWLHKRRGEGAHPGSQQGTKSRSAQKLSNSRKGKKKTAAARAEDNPQLRSLHGFERIRAYVAADNGYTVPWLTVACGFAAKRTFGEESELVSSRPVTEISIYDSPSLENHDALGSSGATSEASLRVRVRSVLRRVYNKSRSS